jgi:hypothetical protein
MKELKISFTEKEITPRGGISLLRQMLERIEIEKALEEVRLPQQGSNKGYDPKQLIQNFWIGVWSGANCFEHLEVTRHDEVIREIWEWERMAGSRAFQRYFNKFNQAINQEVFTGLYQWFFKNLHFDNYRYSCFITNVNQSAKMIYDIYRNRVDAENRIKKSFYFR